MHLRFADSRRGSKMARHVLPNDSRRQDRLGHRQSRLYPHVVQLLHYSSLTPPNCRAYPISAHVPSCLVQSFLGNDATRQSSDSMRQTGKTSAAGGDSHQVGELRGMLQTLERLGYDLDSLLASVGMQRGDVENLNAYISPRACSMVFARANEEGRIPNLPLQLAIHTPIGSNPLLDYLIVSSASVEQGLERLSRYLRIVNPAIRIIVENRRDTARVVVESAPGPFEMELCVSLSLLRFARE